METYKEMIVLDDLIRSQFSDTKVFFSNTMFVVILSGKRRIECYHSGNAWDALCCLTGEDYKAVPYRTLPTLLDAINKGLAHWGENAISQP